MGKIENRKCDHQKTEGGTGQEAEPLACAPEVIGDLAEYQAGGNAPPGEILGEEVNYRVQALGLAGPL